MKRLIIISVIIMLSITSFSQNYYNSNIYDENGQYLKECKSPIKQANIFETGVYFLGKAIYPRGTLEAYSVFDNGLGIWSFNKFQQAVIKDDWIEKGYTIPNHYNLGVSLALSFDFIGNNSTWYKTFLGLAYQSGQMYFGPIAGFCISKSNWELKVYGMYSLKTAYKDEYSQEEIDKYAIYGDPIYIKGFDPNSWYKVSLNYHLCPNFYLGLESERFYGTNFTGKYDLNVSTRNISQFYVKAMSGFDFEFERNTFFMGLVLVL